MDCNMLGFPVQFPELAETHVHQVGNAIQPFHPLLSPSSPAFNLSQHQDLFQWVSSLHQVAKVLELQLHHQSFQWIFRTDLFYDWLIWSCFLILYCFMCVCIFAFVLFCFLGRNVCHYKILQLTLYIFCPSQGYSHFPKESLVLFLLESVVTNQDPVQCVSRLYCVLFYFMNL